MTRREKFDRFCGVIASLSPVVHVLAFDTGRRVYAVYVPRDKTWLTWTDYVRPTRVKTTPEGSY